MCATYCCTRFMTIDSKKCHITAERGRRQQSVQLLHFVDQENAQLVIGKTQNLHLLCVSLYHREFCLSNSKVYVSSDHFNSFDSIMVVKLEETKFLKYFIIRKFYVDPVKKLK